MGQHGEGPGSVTGWRYAIRVEGLLDDHWRQWLDGMTITHEQNGISRLEGYVIDQAALHGLFHKLRDLRLPILSVQRLGAAGNDAPLSEQVPESRTNGTSRFG